MKETESLWNAFIVTIKSILFHWNKSTCWLNNQTLLLSVAIWNLTSMDYSKKYGNNLISLEFTLKNPICNPIGLTPSFLLTTEMDAQLRVSANRFTEIFPNNSSTLKSGERVVSLFLKKLVWTIFYKMKMSFKYTKARLRVK